MRWQLLMASMLLTGCSLPSLDLASGGSPVAAEQIGAGMYRIPLRPPGWSNCGLADECTLLGAAEAAKGLGGTHFMVVPGHGSPSQSGFAYIKVFRLSLAKFCRAARSPLMRFYIFLKASQQFGMGNASRLVHRTIARSQTAHHPECVSSSFIISGSRLTARRVAVPVRALLLSPTEVNAFFHKEPKSSVRSVENISCNPLPAPADEQAYPCPCHAPASPIASSRFGRLILAWFRRVVSAFSTSAGARVHVMVSLKNFMPA